MKSLLCCIISSIEIDIGAVGVEVCEETFIGWAEKFSAYDREVGVYDFIFADYVLGQRVVGEVISVALNAVAYFEVASLPASEGLGHEGAICH